MTNRILNISTQKVGGLRFVRIGRLSLSFCLTRKPVKAKPVEPAARFTARPTMWTMDGLTYAGVRLYRNGRLAAVRWSEAGFSSPADAWAHACAAVARVGLKPAR